MLERLPGNYFVRNAIARRALLFQLVRRDFRQRFAGSVAGWLWGVIHPLVLLVSYWFVFSVCLKQNLPGNQNYAVFLFAGMLPWLLFSETVTRSAGSLLENSNLITKTVFPSEMLPISVFLSSLISHLIALVLALAAAIAVTRQVNPALALLPLLVLLLGLFSVGVAWMVSGLQVYLRDTAQVLLVALTFWFWLTPIFIPESRFPHRLRFLIAANPLAYVVRGYRDLLLGSQLPRWSDLGMAALFGLAAFCLGGLFFRQLKRGFADVL